MQTIIFKGPMPSCLYIHVSDTAFQNMWKCVDCCTKLECGILMTPDTFHLHDSTPHSTRECVAQAGQGTAGRC